MRSSVEQGALIGVGFAIGDGAVNGTARFVASPSELDTLRRGEILLAEDVTPEWGAGLERAVCIITHNGDPSCHVAGLSRALNIPVVVGAGTGASRIWSGARLAVSCQEGIGRVHEVPEPSVNVAQSA